VLQRINSIDAALVVEREELLQQVETFAAKVSAKPLLNIPILVLPIAAALDARKTRPTRHALLSWRADQPEDAMALVDICLAFENGPPLEHFAKDAADTPQVDSRGVSLEGQEQLRRTIPSRDDKAGVVTDSHPVAAPGLWCDTLVMARKTKVGDLEDAAV